MRQFVAPFGCEPVLAQRFVLQADLVPFFVVGREAQATRAPERISGDRLESIESRLGAEPELLRRLCAVRLAGDVISSGSAAQGEAAVPTTRSFGDSARIVHAHTQAAARERKRARDTGDAGADDRDVDFPLRARVDRARRLVEPEWRVHAADATGT